MTHRARTRRPSIAARFFALELRGWSRATRGSSDVYAYRKRAGDITLELALRDPFTPRAPQTRVRVGTLSIADGPKTAALGDLGPVEASELLRDVTLLID